MERGSVAFIVAILAMGCLIPMFSDGADAIGPEDYDITIPGFERHSVIEITISNGETRTLPIYITNNMEHHLDVEFNHSSENSKVHVGDIESITIDKRKAGGDPVISKVDLTFSVDKLTVSQKGAMVFLYVNIADVEAETMTVVPISFSVDVVSEYDVSGSFNKFFGIIPNNLPEPFDSPVVPFLVTIVSVLALCYVLVKLIVPFLGLEARRHSEGKDSRRLEHLMVLAVMIIAILFLVDPGLRILGADIEAVMEAEKFAQSILTVLAAVVIWNLYMAVARAFLKRMRQDEESQWDESLMPVFAFFGKLILWLGGTAVILYIYRIDLTATLFSLGFVTLGITIGAKTVLSQLFHGIIMITTRRLKRGDFIKYEGEKYFVRRVTIMYTILVGQYKDSVIAVPNSKIGSGIVLNSTDNRNDPMRLYAVITIPYGSDVVKAKEVMMESLKKNEDILQDDRYKPTGGVWEYLESGIQMYVAISTRVSMHETVIRKLVYEALIEAGFKVAPDRLDVKILNRDVYGGQVS